MYDRTYGASGYRPDPELQRPLKTHVTTEHKISKFKGKWWHWLLALVAVLLFLFYLFLGEFGFMMFRAPSFTGFPFGSRTYLVLFQNNYELRPTGGFISTYGVMTFKSGLYTGMEFHDVYGEIDEHDYVEPPLVLSTLLSGEGYSGHNFRDANFDPDFRVSKDEIVNFYTMVYPDQEVDGVLAVDFTFLENFVALYDPITVEGHTLTEQNLFESLSTIASDIDRHNLEALASRKDIASPLIKKLITKTVLFPWRISAFLNLLEESFNEKHALASFNLSGLQDSFHSRNWDGALPQSDLGDFLAVNEANYGGMKTDRYITRDVTYDLEVSGRRDVLGNPVLTATVTVTLTHNGGYNIPLSGDYSGYLRTMIPLSSTVIQGASVTEERDDVYVLGELVRLKPGESATYTYSYELPEYVWQDGTYFLHLHKQPGTEGDYYRVIVHAPADTTLDAPLFTVRENMAIFDTHLTEDVNLAFTLVGDENGPRIISHEVTALNQITIVFNEAVNVDSAGDPMNYHVIDLDETNAGTTDEVTVTSVTVDGAAVILNTSGMTEQPDEFYDVTLQGITDGAGNAVNPSPRAITVVQRAIEETPSEEEVVEEEAVEDAATPTTEEISQ